MTSTGNMIFREKKTIKPNQKELNDLVRNCGLPKDGSEYLASWLKSRNLILQIK